MDLFSYIIFSAVYILTIHLAIAIRDHFNVFLMCGIFVLGGVVGHFLASYEVGFAGAIILSLLFW
jgi:hypothetical protein